MDNLLVYKFNLKLQLAEDVEAVLLILKTDLSFISPLFNEFILIYGRYIDIKNSANRDTISRFDRNLELAKIRGSMVDLVDKLAQSDINKLLDSSSSNLPAIIENDDEYLGFFDYLEIAQNGFIDMTAIAHRIAEYTNQLGNEIKIKGQQITLVNQNTKKEGTTILVRKIFLRVADILDNYNARMSAEIPIFRELSITSLNSYQKCVSFIYQGKLDVESIEQLNNVHLSVSILMVALESSQIGMLGLLTATQQLPNFERSFNKAKRKTEELLSELNDILTQYLEDGRSFIENIEFTLMQNGQNPQLYDKVDLLEKIKI